MAVLVLLDFRIRREKEALNSILDRRKSEVLFRELALKLFRHWSNLLVPQHPLQSPSLTHPHRPLPAE